MKAQSITLEESRRIAEDIRRQPAWRSSSDISCDYYDGNQISSTIAQELEARGMGPLITNIIKPTVNALLGMEAKQRTDWRIKSDDDEHQEVAEAISAKLAEAERETRADQAISEAYANQVKAGLGWVEVGRNPNPFGYRYRVEPVHRREIFWDWSARKPDLSDARYFVRERWYPYDLVAQYFPEKAELITAAGSGWDAEWRLLAQKSEELLHAFDQETRTSWLEDEWRNQESKLIQVREIWYRVFVRENVINLPSGKTVCFDEKNPAHVMAVYTGVAQVREAVFPKLRVSIWVGPHMLQDIAHTSDDLPYIPFWGYREDKTMIPYGVIRDMIPMQDEVNARRRKLLWLLSSKRVLADSDALDTAYNDMSDLVREVARPDAVVVLNPNRRNANGVHVENDLGLSDQQYKIMQDSEEAIQRVAGIYNTMMGRTDGATSGTAINSLVEQGTNSVGDINDNYRYARTLVGERLVDLLIEDMKTQTNVVVMSGEEGRQKKVILNKPMVDEFSGVEYRHNDITRVTLKVALSDIPSSPAYRQQQMVQIGEVLKSMPPQLQAVLVPFYLESTDLPKRREMADLIRKQLGMDVDGQEQQPQIPPELQQQIEQGMQMIQMLQQENQALQQQADGKMQEQQVKQIQFNQSQQLEREKLSTTQALEREKLATMRLIEDEREQFAKLMKVAELKAAKESEERAIAARMEEAKIKAAADAETKMALERMRIESAPKEEPKQDDGKELDQIKSLIEPLQKQIEALAKQEKPEPKESAPSVINLSVGGTKKQVTVKRDASGAITGADVTETDEA
jgi:hypothetical protein